MTKLTKTMERLLEQLNRPSRRAVGYEGVREAQAAVALEQMGIVQRVNTSGIVYVRGNMGYRGEHVISGTIRHIGS